VKVPDHDYEEIAFGDSPVIEVFDLERLAVEVLHADAVVAHAWMAWEDFHSGAGTAYIA
jgi:hypothetical protein